MQDEFVRDENCLADNQFVTNMAKVVSDLEGYEVTDAKHSAFRCRVNWTKHGEIGSSYFMNLEKQNYVNKTMYMVYNHQGVLTKDYREILNTQFEYYDKLYIRDENVHFNLVNQTGIKLDLTNKTR